MYVHLRRLFLLCFFFPAAALGNIDPADLQDLIQSGKYEEALQSAEAEIKAGNRDTAIRFYYAFAAAQLGLTDKAIAEFQQIARELPKAPEPRNNLAVLYAQKGEFDKARVELEAALATHPSYATAHRNLGEIYSAMAAEAYNRALARDEKRPAPAPRLSLLNSLQAPVAAQIAAAPVVTAAPPPKPEPKAGPEPEAASAPKTADTPAAESLAKLEPVLAPVAKPGPNKPAAPSTPVTTQPAPPPPALAVNKVATPKAPAAAPAASAPPPSKVTPAKSAERTAPALSPVKPAEAAPAAPVSASASLLPVEAPLSPSGVEQQARAVTTAVQTWAEAWSERNAEAYLAAYSAGFTPEGGVPRAEWAKVRRDRVTRPQRVAVRLIDLQVKLLDDDRAQARFLQFYSSDVVEDTVEKRLDLVREGGGWKIVREQVGQRQY